MISEQYLTYTLESQSKKLANGKYTIKVRISRMINGSARSEIFQDNSNQSMILQVEAESESIALAKRLIDRSIVGF